MTILGYCIDTDLQAMSTDLRAVPASGFVDETNLGQAMLDDSKHDDQFVPCIGPSMHFYCRI